MSAPLAVAIPLVGAALLAALNRVLPRRAASAIAILASLAALAVSATLVAASTERLLVAWLGGWAPRGGVAVGIAFAVDPVGAGLATLACALVTTSLVFSWRYFDTIGTLYQVLMLAFEGALCGFALTGDLFDLFVFFELMSAAAYALCGYKTEEAGPLQGALNFAITNSVGAVLSLLGIALLYGRTGALNLAQIGATLGARADTLVVVAFVLVSAGFLVKAAVVPFHFWLADAHAVAPTPVCVLFSGVMVQMGLYAVARIYWTVFAPSLGVRADQVRAILVAAGVLTALVGAVMCVQQRHLKRLLAFSTVSHTGILVLGVALLAPRALAGAAVYVAGHAAVKGALFLCAGIVLHRLDDVDEIALLGRARELGRTAIVFVLAAAGLAGLPPFGTFAGERLIDEAARDAGYGWLGIVGLVASALTAGAVLRAGARVFAGWGPSRRAPGQHGKKIEEGRETEAAHRDTPAVMLAPAAGLVLAGLALGLVPGLEHATAAAAARFQDTGGYAAAVLGGVPHAPVVPATSASPLDGVAHGVLATAAAAAFAAFELLRARFPDRSRRALRRLALPFDAIERAHTGHVGDYVTFLVVGVAALGGACVWLLT